MFPILQGETETDGYDSPATERDTKIKLNEAYYCYYLDAFLKNLLNFHS